MSYAVSSESASTFPDVKRKARQITIDDLVSDLPSHETLRTIPSMRVLQPSSRASCSSVSVHGSEPKGRMGSFTEALNYYSPFEVFRLGGLRDVVEVVECTPGLCLRRTDVFLSGADIGAKVL